MLLELATVEDILKEVRSRYGACVLLFPNPDGDAASCWGGGYMACLGLVTRAKTYMESLPYDDSENSG